MTTQKKLNLCCFYNRLELKKGDNNYDHIKKEH